MTIATTLSSYISNIQKVYETLSSFGATIPSEKNIQNIISTIDTVQITGGVTDFKNIIEGNITSYVGTATYISTMSTFNNTGITSIEFPKCSVIGSSAFAGCSSLVYASFPICKSIGGAAFINCYSLPSINLPMCESMGNKVFNNCYTLSILNLNGVSSVPFLGTGVFANTPIANSVYLGTFGSIYVPSSLYYSFITATNWATYSDRITTSPVPSN